MRIVIILGNGKEESIKRAKMANEILRYSDIVIATGHNGEAKLIKEHLDMPCLIEDKAHNTFTNLLYSFRMIPKPTNILIVTDSQHSFRSYMIASIINWRFGYKHKIRTLNLIDWNNWKEWSRLIFWNLWNHRRDLWKSDKI